MNTIIELITNFVKAYIRSNKHDICSQIVEHIRYTYVENMFVNNEIIKPSDLKALNNEEFSYQVKSAISTYIDNESEDIKVEIMKYVESLSIEELKKTFDYEGINGCYINIVEYYIESYPRKVC